MSKPKKLWLSRDKFEFNGGFEGDYRLFKTKPVKKVDVFVPSGTHASLASFCEEEFESATGFTLKPGECKRVTIQIKPVSK